MNLSRSILEIPFDLVENELRRPNDNDTSNNMSIDSQALQDEILHILHEYSDDSVGSVSNLMGDFENTNNIIAQMENNNETIYPKSYMNGYIKFVMESTNSLLEPIEGAVQYNSNNNNNNNNQHERELTHEEVLEIFEATCKEIDEWKSLSDIPILKEQQSEDRKSVV